MIALVIGAVALAYFVWLGRARGRLGQSRVVWTLVSVGAAGAAVLVGLKGQWVISLALVALSLFLSRQTRLPFRRRPNFVPRTPPPPTTGMSASEARGILGVSPGATRSEIESAFRRLMLRAHPDHGGSAGLAAKINAARARLLG